MSPPSDLENGVPRETQGLLNGGTTHYGSARQISARVVQCSYKKLKIIVYSNYVNVLLVLVPFGILSGLLDWGPTAIFILNFLAIIPLAALLSFATEELALEVGETVGGLMNVCAYIYSAGARIRMMRSDRFGFRLLLEMLWN